MIPWLPSRELFIPSLLHTRLIKKLGRDSLLHSRDFRRFWLSATLTNFGAQITMLALPICAVLLLHATPAQMGTLAALESLPFLLFGLPVGVLLDRRRRLPVMMCSDAAVALTLASVPVGWWLGVLSVPWLYVVGFVIGTGYVVGGGAEQVYLTFLVGREGLIDARAKLGVTESASRLLGPGIAGLLSQALGAPFAILFNVAGFTLSLVTLRRIGAREPAPAVPQTHPLHEMREGLAFVWQHPLLRTLAWVAGIWHLLFYGFVALQVLFATRVLGMTPGVLGAAQMLGGIGMLASSVLMAPLSRRIGTGPTMLLGMTGTALGFALLPAIPPALFGSATASAMAYGTVILFFDCGAQLFFIPYISLRQRITPDAFLGRMTSTMRFLTVATAPLGALGAGVLAERFGTTTGLMCIAVGAVALTLATVFATSIGKVKD